MWTSSEANARGDTLDPRRALGRDYAIAARPARITVARVGPPEAVCAGQARSRVALGTVERPLAGQHAAAPRIDEQAARRRSRGHGRKVRRVVELVRPRPVRIRVLRAGAPPDPGLLSAGSTGGSARSEEHTSELQSRENLVCRLLL